MLASRDEGDQKTQFPPDQDKGTEKTFAEFSRLQPPSIMLPQQNQVATFAPIIDEVRKWSIKYDGGRDPLAFIERLEELTEVYMIDIDILPRTMPELLCRTALQWYRDNNEHWKSWTSFKRDFLSFFLPARYFERLEDNIRQRRQHELEKYKDYVLAMQNLMKHSGYNQQQRLERIFQNSHIDFKLYIRRRNFETLAELITLAEEYEGIHKENRRKAETPPRELKRHIIGDHEISNTTRPRVSPETRCGEATELSAESPEIIRQKCGRLNALIKLGGEPAEAVIDTGASRSFVSSRVAEFLNATGSGKKLTTALEILMVDGTASKIFDAVETNIQLGQVSLKAVFHVMPGAIDDVLLGLDILGSMGATVSCGGHQVVLKASNAQNSTANDAQLSQPFAEFQLPPEGIKISIADAYGSGLEDFPQIAERIKRSLTDLTTGIGKHRLKFSTTKYQVVMYRWGVHIRMKPTTAIRTTTNS
ncbi:uncharacterized protein LOC125778484 [Bactrocera dorsalis]|uniref:Uncharacterized protein LOC125778484 n=1 Tax=Bactrocera dorsalis TaxID=27457 RepID=A0ABM3JTP8_BACDO|nr:uncharacterized protein LOC125778484 [Bactrocera dorsalis]